MSASPQSRAIPAMIAGIISIPAAGLAPVAALFIFPIIVLPPIFSLTGIVLGARELRAISAGTLPDDGKMFSIVGIVAGLVGLAIELFMVGSLVLSLIVLLANM